MKKYLPGFIVLATALAASAFTTTSQSTQATSVDDPVLYWFDANGNYEGHRTVSDEAAFCPGGTALCAKGYSEIDEDEQPVPASFDRNVQKP